MGEVTDVDLGGKDESLCFEDNENALEFESDADESEAGSESGDDNELYDDALYGSKRPCLKDESIELTEDQKKVVANLKKMNKKFVHPLFIILFAKGGVI